MQTKVKICGITNLEDARAAADAGADALGFMFYEQSARNVAIETVADIARQISPFIVKVGVFVNPEPDAVMAAIANCGLNLLQFHGDESPAFCVQFGLMSMKAFRIKEASSLEVLPSYRTDAWLLDSFVAGKQGGTGEKFNWDLAIEAGKLGRPIFLAGGLTAANVGEAVARVRPYAVDVSSGVEAVPGKKDPKKVRDFIAAVKSAG